MLYHSTNPGCPERKERLDKLQADVDHWMSSSSAPQLEWEFNVLKAADSKILAVHSNANWNYLLNQAENCLDAGPNVRGNVSVVTSCEHADTVVSRHSIAAIRTAAGCVLDAVDAVLSTTAPRRNAFCMVRPPGHHALCERASRMGNMGELAPEGIGAGFCLINNVMIGAHHAATHHSKRVAVVDIDTHHGNGSLEILCVPTLWLVVGGWVRGYTYCSVVLAWVGTTVPRTAPVPLARLRGTPELAAVASVRAPRRSITRF
jgi:acetoin utilization deacetylase AcuC-like enzyme